MAPMRSIAIVVAALVAAAGAAVAEREDKDNDRSIDHARKAADRADKADDAAEKSRDHAEKGREHARKAAEMRKHGDKWLLRNEDLSIWFHQTSSGKAKPMLKVFATDDDGNKSGFKFAAKRLCEVDANATSCEDAYAKVNLAKAHNWNTEIEQAAGNVTITMRLTDPQGIVGLVFHLRDDAPTLKFDLEVENWAWKSSAHVLLFEMIVDERDEGRVDAGDASDANMTVGGGGYVSWAPTAGAAWGANDTGVLNVSAHVDHDEEDRDGRIALRFDGRGGYEALAYDPELGVQSFGTAAARGTPAPAAFAVLAVAAVAAAVGARRGARRG